MIDAIGVSKSYGSIRALNDVTLQVQNGSIFGLVGTNGAGKSTMLRILAGVMRQDSGSLLIDDNCVTSCPAVRREIFFISDDPYFFPNCTPGDMGAYYRTVYPCFDSEQFAHLLDNFELPANRKIRTFSKGMKKQLAVICALAAQTRYIFCDETFDGLDPVMRQGVKSLFGGEAAERGLTVLIASHNLRELEDISDHIGLLHRGGVLLSHDLDDMKLSLLKFQAVFDHEITRENFMDLDVLTLSHSGSVYTIVVRGDEATAMAALQRENPRFCEVLPLTLEEIFIQETEVQGYDIQKLLV